MTKDNAEIYALLDGMHKNAECELKFRSSFELLIAVVLSAQCTDKRVNKVTEELFKVANTPEQFVAMPTEELERRIFSCGFYHNKALAIKELSQSIIEIGGMPTTRDELMKLRGVGRKTANVVYAVGYGGNAIAVDTHVFRVANRIGIVNAKTPEATEQQLMSGFDENVWSHLHHLLIFHGRYVCHSRKPDCDVCALRDKCKYYAENSASDNK
ncbi:MAG: endonuclease III [Clostridia bacterium]|nr:endonuclease III [Clostridia bacterium]